MKAYYGAEVFEGRIDRSAATIIYMCSGTKDSGGKVDAQLIYIDFQSETEAQVEYLRQRERLDKQFGKPCWDPAQYQVDGLGPRVVWTVRTGIETSITWSKVVNKQPLHWSVMIFTHDPTDRTNTAEPFRTLFAKSSCEKPAASVNVLPNTSLERTRER